MVGCLGANKTASVVQLEFLQRVKKKEREAKWVSAEQKTVIAYSFPDQRGAAEISCIKSDLIKMIEPAKERKVSAVAVTKSFTVTSS